MNNEKYLAIDIGGTKIEIAIFDNNYILLDSVKFNTSDFRIKSFDFIDDVKSLIKKNFTADIKKVGVSFNCVVNNGVIVYSSLLGGYVNYELEKEFSNEFRCDVHLENDVNSMAIAENKLGKGKNLDSFVLLNLGTGIRSSYFLKNKCVYGYTGNAGEISQKEIFVSEFNEVIKNDDFLAGIGFSNIYKKVSGIDKNAKDIFELLIKGDEEAVQVWKIYKKYFVLFLQDLTYFYNPQKIIINGSFKKSLKHYLPEIIKDYKEKTIDFFYFKDIEISKIDNAACLGVVL